MSPWRPARDHYPCETVHSPRTRGSGTYWRRRPMPGEPPGSRDPLDPAGLVGRAAEAAAIRRMLDGAPLVTVTGLPGVGKTAVSLAAARGRRGLRRRQPAAAARPATGRGAAAAHYRGGAAAGRRGRAVRPARGAGGDTDHVAEPGRRGLDLRAARQAAAGHRAGSGRTGPARPGPSKPAAGRGAGRTAHPAGGRPGRPRHMSVGCMSNRAICPPPRAEAAISTT
jgi:hypothetical protein